MENNLEYRRRLPPELLAEMHKCLPLANAIYVLVNVSKTFVLNNSTRMHRNIQRLKTSLNDYIDSMIEEEDEEGQNDRKELRIYNDFGWTSQLDALIRYGTWMTSTRRFWMPSGVKIVGVPENFLEDLLLYMANSSSPEMMLQFVEMNFVHTPISTFLEQLVKKNEQYPIWGPNFFESAKLETDNGQILHIYQRQIHSVINICGVYKLFFIVVNKMNWFEISIYVDSSNKFIRRLKFTRSEMQPSHKNGFEIIDLKEYRIEENGDKLEAMQNFFFEFNLDIFLRHGSAFSQFRHFKINPEYILSQHPHGYAEFLISHVSNTNHPEDFLDSIDLNLNDQCFSFLDEIWRKCFIGVPQGGKSIKCGKEQFYILSAKIPDSQKKFEFTLINRPTNGEYLFDVGIKYGKEGLKQIIRIKIQKRKSANIFGMNCIVLVKKRKAINDDEGEEDGPTCSSKIMKK